MSESILRTKSGKRVICPIMPSMIDATKHLYDAFGHMETEVSAGWIIRLCQKRGHWGPFTKKEIEDFYHEKHPQEDFWFNGLIEDGFIVSQDGQNDPYEVTFEFVLKCYESSPVMSE